MSAHRISLWTTLLLLSGLAVNAQQPQLVVQTGHNAAITSVAFSPDGRLLATAGNDSTIKLWEGASGIQLASLVSGFKPIIAFSPDGELLASAGLGEPIQLWNVVSRATVKSLKGGELSVKSIAFSPDGKLLASGNSDGIRLFNVASGDQVRSLDFETNSVAFNRNGKILAGAGGISDPTIRFWDVDSGKELRTFRGHTDAIYSIAFSPDEQIVASGSRDESVRLWDVASGKQLLVLASKVLNLQSIAFSPDGKILASGGAEINSWDVASGKALRTMGGPFENYVSIAFSPDGKMLAGGSLAGRSQDAKLWEVATGTQLRSLGGHATWSQSVAFSGDGKLLASGSYDSSIKLWGLAGKSPFESLVGHAHWVDSVAFSPDGKLLASGSHDNSIKLWDVASAKQLKSLAGGYWVKSVAFSPDGKLLATVSHEPGIKLWEVSSGTLVSSLNAGEVSSVAFSPDGTLLAAGKDQGPTILWDVSAGVQRKSLEASGEDISSVAFSPDGKLLAGGGRRNNTVKLWDVASGEQLRSLTGHTAQVNSVAFGPDGRLLASASSDRTVKLWEVKSGAQIKSLEGHTNLVVGVAFSPDAKVIASGSFDGTIKLWKPDSNEALATLISLDKDDWVVVTPDGLFDGSPGGWNKIIWRFNNNTFNYSSVEAFFSDFFYPGLLNDIFAGKHPKAASDISQKDRRPPHLRLSLRDAQSSATLATRNVTVSVDVSQAPAGARDVRLFRNGSLVTVWHGDVLRGESRVTLEAQIPIVAGENKLTAYAFNHDNIKSSDASLVIIGAETLRRAGTMYVLAAGVDKYANAGYDLKFAVADVDEMSKELEMQQARLGYYARTVLISLLNEQATKANLILALQRFAGQAAVPDGVSSALKQEIEKIKNVDPEDALIIYFAGHGTARDQHFYLLPHDFVAGSEEQLKASSISETELNEILETAGAGKLLMVIDACQSGQALGGEKEGRGPMNSKGLAQLAYDKGMYILAAAQSYQAAKEVSRSLVGQKIGHGLLTFSLLKGLTLARADSEGKISERDWMNYAVDQVPLMQIEEMKKRNLENLQAGGQGQRGAELVFVIGDDDNIDPLKRNVQRPRVFYRRELEARPLIVAKQ